MAHTVRTVNLDKVETNLAAPFDSVGVGLFQAFEILVASLNRVRVVAFKERDLRRGNDCAQVSPGSFNHKKKTRYTPLLGQPPFSSGTTEPLECPFSFASLSFQGAGVEAFRPA